MARMRLPILLLLASIFFFLFTLPPTASSGRIVPRTDDDELSGISLDMMGSDDVEEEEDDDDDDKEEVPPSSSSSSSSEDDENEEDEGDDDAVEFVENVVGWRPVNGKCPEGKFLDAASGQCRPCSICGPDLYEREHCLPDSDTVCDWCLLGSDSVRRNNADFRAKCAPLLALRDEFRSALARRRVAAGRAKPALYVAMEKASEWWKAELLVEMAFYMALIALVLAVIRFLAKRRSTTYRTVTVTPPVLEEWEQKNIVRAAESIRDKLGNKGYAKLEEEFI